MQRFAAALLVVFVTIWCAEPSFAQGRKSARAADAAVMERITATLDALQADGDFETASAETGAILDEVIAWGAPNEPATMREAVFAERLVRLLGGAEGVDRPGLFAFLRANPTLAGDLIFTIEERAEDPSQVFALLERLRSGREELLEKHAPLVAAICVAHDVPVVRRFNENVVESPGPEALLDYYTRNASRMYYRAADMPPELLAYVVDATPSIEEMTWALDRYAGHNDVGGLFYNIRYDLESFYGGRAKDATLQGYTLENIHRFGGVCVDQAYFAVMVGKSIGVPTAYVVARAAQGGHAWVGFLQRNGKGALWNFNTGRYDAYKGLKGSVFDPQTGEEIGDGDISLEAGLIGYERAERQEAAAYAMAADRLLGVMIDGREWPPARDGAAEEEQAAPPKKLRSTAGKRAAPGARAADAAGVLDLVEKSVDICPFRLDTWRLVGATAQAAGGLDIKQRRDWANAVQRLCGADYPDFTIATLRPLIDSIEDPREQDKLWSSLLRLCGQRPDLAAEILTAQGMLWARAGNTDEALACYRQVLDRHTEDGPFVMEALVLADRLLTSEGAEQDAIRLYQTTWGRCRKPASSAYYRMGSNWFQVGALYSARLAAGGDVTEATRVRESLMR